MAEADEGRIRVGEDSSNAETPSSSHMIHPVGDDDSKREGEDDDGSVVLQTDSTTVAASIRLVADEVDVSGTDGNAIDSLTRKSENDEMESTSSQSISKFEGRIGLKHGVMANSSSSHIIESVPNEVDPTIRRTQSAPPGTMTSRHDETSEGGSFGDVSTGDRKTMRQKRRRRRGNPSQRNTLTRVNDDENTPQPFRNITTSSNQSDCTYSSDGSFDDDVVGELQNDMLTSPTIDPRPTIGERSLPTLSRQSNEDPTPGAFHTQGRALGDFPVWGRTEMPPGPLPRLHHTSSRSSTHRRSSLSSGHSSAHRSSPASPGTRRHVRMFGRISSRWRSSVFRRSTMVVEARLVSSETRPAPTSVEAETTVINADKVVTEETVAHERRRFWIISLLVGLGLIALIVGLLLKFSIGNRQNRKENIDNTTKDAIDSSNDVHQTFPTNDTIDSDLLCKYGEDDGFLQSPVIQCLCTGNLETIHSSRIALFHKYAERLEEIGVLSDTYGRPDGATCQDARTVALYWLAETESDVSRYSNQTLVNRFSLAVLFAEWMGMRWMDKHLWLTGEPACDWGGITCDDVALNLTNADGNPVRELQLSNLGLIGTIPEIGLKNMEHLEVIDLSGNPELVGTVPGMLSYLHRLKVLDLRGTSIDAMASGAYAANGTFSDVWCSKMPNLSVRVSCNTTCSCCREDCSF